MDVDADASTKENVEPSDANARRADVAHRVRVVDGARDATSRRRDRSRRAARRRRTLFDRARAMTAD
jgi:hypothetical protein|tara:strand:- start:199 stop:399 length:201 start_codon:yes stop_codon:yes gene_type:complete